MSDDSRILGTLEDPKSFNSLQGRALNPADCASFTQNVRIDELVKDSATGKEDIARTTSGRDDQHL